MPLEAGQKLGPYEIVEPIGKGGMGEVYRARDAKLERDVAIKVLPDELAADEERVARFEREAKLLASLNHPNIASIYGFESNAIVLELVEGPTLAERIAQGPIPVDEAIIIAKQIADALEAGHDAGIIHRDLKPANIKLKEDGAVKVLDYGLAKALEVDEPSSADSELSHSPTLTRQGTQLGVILGTAPYMSPEQAKGKKVDERTDIWAFGAVLYEMLTGNKAFRGDDVSDTLAAVLRAEPDWDTLPSAFSPTLRPYLRRCLEKDPKARIRDIGDARLALDGGFEATDGVAADAGATAGGMGKWNPLTSSFAALFLLAGGLFVWALLQNTPPRAPVARFESPFREGQAPIGAKSELMPDGSGLVYVGPGSSAAANQLWMRLWSELEAKPISGTEGSGVWLEFDISPDGREVAFVSEPGGPLQVVPMAGGPRTTLVDSAVTVSWPEGEWIYFVSSSSFGIERVRAIGGDAENLTTPSDGEAHNFPYPLPDSNALLFQVSYRTGDRDAEIWSIDVETTERRMLTVGTNPRLTSSGHLLFGTHDGRLMAAPFDVDRVAMTGGAVTVARGLAVDWLFGAVGYTASEDGTLGYWVGEASTAYEFVWVTRSGEVTPVDAAEPFHLPVLNTGWRLSPDGSRIAFTRAMDGDTNIWIVALPDGPVSRLTYGEGRGDLLPEWAPDGESVMFNRGNHLWSKAADGTGEPELLFDGFSVAKGVWSPDGEWLVLRRVGGELSANQDARDILAIRPSVDVEVVPLITTAEFVEQAPAISRDGRWLAYSSNDTGRHEIFVRPFPDVNAGKWQISTGGGIQPVWARGKSELFFVEPATRALKVLEFSATGTTFQRTRVTTLFEIPESTFYVTTGNYGFYDVALDDERFLMARRHGTAGAPSFILIQNFSEELKRLVPTER